MIHPNQCLSIQVDTATARTIPNGCVYREGVLISYATDPREEVQHTNDMGFWRYARLGGVGTQQVVRSGRAPHDQLSTFTLATRNSMPLHNWVDDMASTVSPLESYLEAPRGHDGGLFVSFHGIHLEKVGLYLDEVAASDLPRASLASLLGIALQNVPDLTVASELEASATVHALRPAA